MMKKDNKLSLLPGLVLILIGGIWIFIGCSLNNFTNNYEMVLVVYKWALVFFPSCVIVMLLLGSNRNDKKVEEG